MPAAPMIKPMEGALRQLDLRHWSSNTFYDDFTGNILALSAAHGSGKTARLLDAAELYLSHMLVIEAVSVLESVIPENQPQIERHHMLQEAAQLLSGKPVKEVETSPLISSMRSDVAFWTSLQAIATADVALLNSNIEASFFGLSQQSKAVLRAMLPVFTEAAIETGHPQYADAGLRLIDELPELAMTPTALFLRGRAQERRGNASSALAAYLEAAEGWDEYAARARLAVADMSLSNGSRGALLAAQSTLVNGAEAWRGDRYELEILKRLNRIYAGTENEVEQLITIGKLVSRFPTTTEAEMARVEAQDVLASFYRKGGEGAFTLAAWMKEHLRLLAYFRTLPSFAGRTEEFADYVHSLGATVLAVQEYRRAIRLVLTHEEDRPKETERDLFRLNLKLAKAQVHGGLSSDARLTLDLMDAPQAAADKEEFAILKAKVLDDLGDRPAFLQTFVSAPTADHMRKMGLTLAAEGQWTQSADVFNKFWRKFPHEFSVQDATRLLIAANRTDDTETLNRVTRAFPRLTESKALINLANSINYESPEVLPLRADEAANRLGRLENAFQSIKDSGISQ